MSVPKQIPLATLSLSFMGCSVDSGEVWELVEYLESGEDITDELVYTRTENGCTVQSTLRLNVTDQDTALFLQYEASSCGEVTYRSAYGGYVEIDRKGLGRFDVLYYGYPMMRCRQRHRLVCSGEEDEIKLRFRRLRGEVTR